MQTPETDITALLTDIEAVTKFRFQRNGPRWWREQVERHWDDIRRQYWIHTGKWLPLDPPSERVSTTDKSDNRKAASRKKSTAEKEKLDKILKDLII